MYVVDWLCFLTLEKWPSVGDVLCVPAVHSPLVTQGPGASWSLGGIWPAFADLICRLRHCSFLASGACPLVGEACLEVCAGFLMGGAGACPPGG